MFTEEMSEPGRGDMVKEADTICIEKYFFRTDDSAADRKECR